MFTMDSFQRWLQRKFLISTASGDHKSLSRWTFFVPEAERQRDNDDKKAEK